MVEYKSNHFTEVMNVFNTYKMSKFLARYFLLLCRPCGRKFCCPNFNIGLILHFTMYMHYAFHYKQLWNEHLQLKLVQCMVLRSEYTSFQ